MGIQMVNISLWGGEGKTIGKGQSKTVAIKRKGNRVTENHRSKATNVK